MEPLSTETCPSMYGQLKRETGQVATTVLNNGDVTVSSLLRTYDGFKDDDGPTKKNNYMLTKTVYVLIHTCWLFSCFLFSSVDQNQRER